MVIKSWGCDVIWEGDVTTPARTSVPRVEVGYNAYVGGNTYSTGGLTGVWGRTRAEFIAVLKGRLKFMSAHRKKQVMQATEIADGLRVGAERYGDLDKFDSFHAGAHWGAAIMLCLIQDGNGSVPNNFRLPDVDGPENNCE
jgi:hypothetical protein